jgi:PAS domain S-box-containing protein
VAPLCGRKCLQPNDTRQHITNVNKEFCSITGFDKGEVIGKRCSILGCYVCRDECSLFNAAHPEQLVKKECTIVAKDGRKLKIIKNADVLYDDSKTGLLMGGLSLSWT